MREAWQDIRGTLGHWPLLLVAAYAAVAFGLFAVGRGELPRALESAVYSLLMLFVWLIAIAYFVRSPPLGRTNSPETPVKPADSRRELVTLLAILGFNALLTTWVWLGPAALRWPSWVIALAALYGLSLVFMRWRGYGPEHVGLDFGGRWKGYLLAIVAQMLLAQGVSLVLPRGIWRRDLVAGAVALLVVMGLAVILSSPLMGRWRLGLSGVWEDLKGLKPFAGLLALLAIGQVVGSILFVGDAGVLTRPLYPLNGYFAQGPVPEEIFYRGLLQTRLQVALSTIWPASRSVGWAILLTGLVFTAMHTPSHLAVGADLGAELLDFTGGLANAFAAGYLYYRTGKLLPTIVFHSLSFL